VAVFIPILFMDGMLGRLFREFAVVMTAAILVSMLVSLTTTPMMCAALLPKQVTPSLRSRRSQWLRIYKQALAWALRHPWWMWLVLVAAIALNVTLYRAIPKGFFPQQDTGRINGFIRADQSSSFQAMQQRLRTMLAIVQADPAVETVTGFTGEGQRNAARILDLALRLFADQGRKTTVLELPHPRLAERRFVLAPLAEIAPDMHIPGCSLTVAELLERLPGQGEIIRMNHSRRAVVL
jgi:2-amino-4-hydroxy-6-hydroxymethyldihydropteridine diphosphokinase